ncbi:hypothetical protein REPUB_Repub09cG0136400 [Reevesia pubescens]
MAVMERTAEKRMKYSKWRGNYGHLVLEKFEENMDQSLEWRVHFNGDAGYEIKKVQQSYAVNLKTRTCSCQAWNLSGIPCCHAICAIWDNKEDQKDYIHEWYHKDKYMETYKYTLNLINDPNEWKKHGLNKLLPPLLRKMRGRPKRNRNPELHKTNKNRTRLPKTGRVMSCSICRKSSHNKARCPKKEKVSLDIILTC